MREDTIRRKLASRLSHEMQRRGLARAEDLSRAAGVPTAIVQGYLDRERSIDLDELTELCAALGTDPLWLLSHDWKETALNYRGLDQRLLSKVAQIEHALSLTFDLLPPHELPPQPSLPTTETDAQILLWLLDKAVARFRAQWRTIPEMYRAYRVPILAFRSGNRGPDAFSLALHDRAIVCVNLDAPYVRVAFSLLHEMAHLIFDRFGSPEVETLTVGDLYGDTVTPEARSEWVANKFAQLYLVPFETAAEWAGLPEAAATDKAAKFAMTKGVSTAVVANALFDACRHSAHPVRFDRLRHEIETRVPAYSGPREVAEYAQHSTDHLKALVRNRRNEFSDRQWQVVREAFGLEDE